MWLVQGGGKDWSLFDKVLRGCIVVLLFAAVEGDYFRQMRSIMVSSLSSYALVAFLLAFVLLQLERMESWTTATHENFGWPYSARRGSVN